jgi:hypothetical protein
VLQPRRADLVTSRPKRLMPESRRQALQSAWTAERRAEASAKAQERYRAWAAEHPDRAAFVTETWAAIERGELERPTCSVHHRPGHPSYDWQRMAVVGWRCRAGHWL